MYANNLTSVDEMAKFQERQKQPKLTFLKMENLNRSVQKYWISNKRFSHNKKLSELDRYIDELCQSFKEEKTPIFQKKKNFKKQKGT